MADPIANLWDDFNSGSIDATKWSIVAGSWAFTTGQACATMPSGGASLQSVANWSLEQSSAFVEVTSFANGAGAASGTSLFEIFSSVGSASNVYIEINASTGNIKFARQSGGVDVETTTIVYSNTTMRWLRIRESGSFFLFETSPDSATWTTRLTAPTQAWVSSVKALLFANQSGGAATTKCFDNFNVASASSRTVPIGPEFTVSSAGALGTNRCNKVDLPWPYPCAVASSNALRKSLNPCGLWVQPPAHQSLQVENNSVSVSSGDELSIISIELTNPDTCRNMLFYLPLTARMTVFTKKADTQSVDAWTLGVMVTGVDNADAGFNPLQADDIGAGYLTGNYVWAGAADYFWTATPGETTTIEVKVKSFGSGANIVTKFQAELGVIGMSVVAA